MGKVVTKRIHYFSLILLSLVVSRTFSQETFPKLNFVNIKEGISKVGIYSILQDNYGFIWIGTNGSGLYRYDGTDYKSYKHVLNDTTSLNNSLIYSTYFDSRNRLWVGTAEGLNLYDRNHDRFRRIPVVENEGFGNTISISSLMEDTEGNLYIGAFGSGLFRLNTENFQVERVVVDVSDGSAPLSIQAIQRDSNGKIFTGTNRGLFEVDKTTKALKRSYLKGTERIAATEAQIKSMLIDKENNIWIGTFSEGLQKISRPHPDGEELLKTDKFLFFRNTFFTLIMLPDGTLMCGTENDGLFHIKADGSVLNHYVSRKNDERSILSNSIWSLYLDGDDRIWLGYYNKGVAVYDKLYDKFKDITSFYNNPNSLQISSVTAISQDSLGKLWIGMDGGGIDILDQETNQFTHINISGKGPYSGLTSDYIQTIFIDSKQNIWAGSWENGLYYLKKGTKSFINYNTENTNGTIGSNTIMSITEDAKGTIWIGTYHNGLHSYEPSNGRFVHHNSEAFVRHNLVGIDILKVLIDRKDNIWLGTSRGLYKIEQQIGGSFLIRSLADNMAQDNKQSSAANHILSLYESEDNMLWIGTKGAGLCKYNPKTDTFTWYNKLNGLIEENVSSIISSLDGNIWLSGNSGISTLNIQTNEFTNYTSNDGLISNDFNMDAAFRDPQGQIYFGSYQGVDYFDPRNINTNTTKTALYISELKLFNEKVMPGQKGSPLKRAVSETDSIVLTHTQSVFTLEYSGINYTRPEENRYAYYLKGYETSWNHVGKKRSATYTNLDPGNYTFILKASNNDGVWNEEPLELHIQILAPWWKANWALFSYVALFFLGVYSLNRLAQNRLKEKQLISSEREKRLQEKDLDEKRFQFFTNISHEFRTPLTLIINPLKDILKDNSLNLPERIKEKHHVIYKNTDRLHRLVNELLDYRKLELNTIGVKAKELNLAELIKEIVGHFTEEAFERNVHFTSDIDAENQVIWTDESMLEKIIFNILSNAFKVTPDGGAINVQLVCSNSEYQLPLVDPDNPTKGVEIIISDTGPGLEENQIPRIFERFYQVDNLNKSYYGGTGIGLEVVQSFLNLLKGKIEVKSEVGEGSIFRIILPEGNAHFKTDEMIWTVNEPNQIYDDFTTTIPGKKTSKNSLPDDNVVLYSLLIVEDNTELRNYLRNELKNQYKVFLASNGNQGLELAKKMLPDVILTDILMPEMDGFDFCKNIKSDIRTSHIPLMMLTAKARIEDRMEGIEMGADAYMVKPFDMRLLKLRLSQLITSRQLIFNKYFSVISDLPANSNTTSLDKEFIEKVLNYIHKNIDDPELSVEALASQSHLSRSQFYRKIKALTNQTATEFLRNIRLEKAKQLIEKGNSNITEVGYRVGFSSPSYFTKRFKSYFGHLPTEV